MPKRPPLIVVVDDDEGVRHALHFLLRVEGFYVLTFSAGPMLLAEPALPGAGCVILEERNKVMGGFELLRRLRVRNLRLPAILLTTHASAPLVARAEQAGVRIVLEKPLFGDILLDHVRITLSAER